MPQGYNLTKTGVTVDDHSKLDYPTMSFKNKPSSKELNESYKASLSSKAQKSKAMNDAYRKSLMAKNGKKSKTKMAKTDKKDMLAKK